MMAPLVSYLTFSPRLRGYKFEPQPGHIHFVKILPDYVAQSDVRPAGMHMEAVSILTSGKILLWSLIL